MKLLGYKEVLYLIAYVAAAVVYYLYICKIVCTKDAFITDSPRIFMGFSYGGLRTIQLGTTYHGTKHFICDFINAYSRRIIEGAKQTPQLDHDVDCLR